MGDVGMMNYASVGQHNCSPSVIRAMSDLDKHRIRVNAVALGFLATQLVGAGICLDRTGAEATAAT